MLTTNLTARPSVSFKNNWPARPNWPGPAKAAPQAPARPVPRAARIPISSIASSFACRERKHPPRHKVARALARKFHSHNCAAAAAVVAQVSKPAVSPTSKSAECRDCIGARRFGNLRYSRFGNLRYRQRCEISGLAVTV